MPIMKAPTQIPLYTITKIGLKFEYSKLHPHLPGGNELMLQYQVQISVRPQQ